MVLTTCKVSHLPLLVQLQVLGPPELRDQLLDLGQEVLRRRVALGQVEASIVRTGAPGIYKFPVDTSSSFYSNY